MEKMLDLITGEVTKAFIACGYDEKYARVTLSNRPDLCEYQCNGALAAAKEYHCAPFMISDKVAEELKQSEMFESVDSVKPGFLNLILSKEYLASYMQSMQKDEERLGCEKAKNPKTIIIDYGGPNVAKPLHVGHLRSAIIGESIKRIGKFMGHEVIGDVHLEEIYPTASAKSKEDEAYKEAAMKATSELQAGRRGYQALLSHILNVSVTDLKKNYENLNVSFELWKGESDAQPYIPDMVEQMKKDGFAYMSDGALVVDVAKEEDTKEIPPCIILKSDGASLYTTTDLATLIMREQDYHPDEVIYVVDKRQELHFVQVFRCAKKTGIVPEDTKLEFLGFGTMNGKDGKPFKTREGGVMRLEMLMKNINEKMYEKITENHTVDPNEAEKTAKIVALSAIKYGDLSNQASKDYIFDIDRFTSFEGNTGPYILYTIVRIKSILAKYAEAGKSAKDAVIQPAHSDSEKALMLELSKFNAVMENAYEEKAPHKLCAYIYDLSNAFNHFYHETKIMAEEDAAVQAGYIRLLELTKSALEICIDLLGFEAPEKM